MNRMAPVGCSFQDLSIWSRAATPARSCFGGLIRSLPDPLPRVVARYRPASKFSPGRRRYDVAYRKELSRMPIVAEQYTFVIGVDTHAATHSLALVNAATGAVVDESVFPNTPPGLDRALTWITRRIGEHSIDRHRGGRFLWCRACTAGERCGVAGRRAIGDARRPTSRRRQDRRVGCGPHRTLGSGGRHLAVAVAPGHRPAGGAAGAGRGPRADG